MISKIIVTNFPWLPDWTWDVWEETLITSGMAKWKTSFLNAIAFAYTWLDVEGKKIIWITNKTIVKIIDANSRILNESSVLNTNKFLFNYNSIKDFFWIETISFPKNKAKKLKWLSEYRIFSELYIDTFIKKNLMNFKSHYLINNSTKISNTNENLVEEIQSLLSYNITKSFYNTLSKEYNSFFYSSNVVFDKKQFNSHLKTASICYDEEYISITMLDFSILISRSKKEITHTFTNSLTYFLNQYPITIVWFTFDEYIQKLKTGLKEKFKEQNDYYINNQKEYSNEITERYNQLIYYNNKLNPIGVIAHTRWISAKVIMDDGTVRNMDTLSRTERALYEINILSKAKQKYWDNSPILIDDFPLELNSDDFIDYLISMASDNQIFITQTTKGDLSVKY